MCIINEEEFFDTCDEVDNIDEFTFPYEYMPTVEELKYLGIEEHIQEHFKFLLYLSNSISTAQSTDVANYIKGLMQKNVIIG